MTPGVGWFLYVFLIPFWAMFPDHHRRDARRAVAARHLRRRLSDRQADPVAAAVVPEGGERTEDQGHASIGGFVMRARAATRRADSRRAAVAASRAAAAAPAAAAAREAGKRIRRQARLAAGHHREAPRRRPVFARVGRQRARSGRRDSRHRRPTSTDLFLGVPGRLVTTSSSRAATTRPRSRRSKRLLTSLRRAATSISVSERRRCASHRPAAACRHSTTAAPGGCAACSGMRRSSSSSPRLDQVRANAQQRIERSDAIGQALERAGAEERRRIAKRQVERR